MRSWHYFWELVNGLLNRLAGLARALVSRGGGETREENPAARQKEEGMEKGRIVRLRDNPGRRGTTTGREKPVGSRIMTEVDFGPSDRSFEYRDLLEFVDEYESMDDLLRRNSFGGSIDLRRILIFEKIKGNLTNIFYSMEVSNTDFHPHQFKPVLKFIESPVGRLLIADEVGLGKTIESVYIWKELQARQAARRLLIVCPAMLREKWRGDLKRRFNITGEIINAKDLLEKLSGLSRGESFTYIASLDSLRSPRGFDDVKQHESGRTKWRARLARYLDEHPASADFALFDLVIIDEAHELRNIGRTHHRLGELLRDSAHHMVLLTATPIQIASENLFRLIQLIDPEEFRDLRQFDEMLKANHPVIRALRCIWRQPPDLEEVVSAVEETASSSYFARDTALKKIGERVQRAIPEKRIDSEERIEIARKLESRSLLGRHMVRSRKREVLKDRIKRTAVTLDVTFSETEREIYERITRRIMTLSSGKKGVFRFALIMRQRQMESSLAAALKGWQGRHFLDKELMDEWHWEELGRTGTFDADDGPPEDVPWEMGCSESELTALEENDTKYEELKGFLQRGLEENKSEKFVIFAFFRDTLRYLARRLRQDGIDTCLIMGGMGDRKNEVLEEFSLEGGPSVLLSSEVGSEGIDLQFCRFLVNYDLPWNPMRVEQRIGRLDRLGQKAESITIVNLAVEDTIADRILKALYERIRLFEENIGDLEEILGERTEKLMEEALKPDLTMEERLDIAEEEALAILNQGAEQKRLEQEAMNLVGFSDYILEHIQESHDRGNWLQAEELSVLVGDFFDRRYPGTSIKPHPELASVAWIQLSGKARTELRLFVEETKSPTQTDLHRLEKDLLCVFDPRQVKEFGRDIELIEFTHPLIQWIRRIYEDDKTRLHCVSAVKLGADKTSARPGDYAFMVHRWSFTGLRSQQLLVHQACATSTGELLDRSASEDLIVAAAKNGKKFVNASNVMGDIERAKSMVRKCNAELAEMFGRRDADFRNENEVYCDQQKINATRLADRRITDLEERLGRYRDEGRTDLIPMNEGRLKKELRQKEVNLERIEQRAQARSSLSELAAGVIRVE